MNTRNIWCKLWRNLPVLALAPAAVAGLELHALEPMPCFQPRLNPEHASPFFVVGARKWVLITRGKHLAIIAQGRAVQGCVSRAGYDGLTVKTWSTTCDNRHLGTLA